MISRGSWRRLEPVIDAALELPPESVAPYLDRECAEEPEVRAEVERLLAILREDSHHVRFLDSPPARLAAAILADPELAARAIGERLTGSTIGPYRVLRWLGRGGMGIVYLARDPRLDRSVALKLLPPWLSSNESSTRRLAEEAKAASALDHPNIETVYDIGTTMDGRPYIAMAYYEGETLADRIRNGPFRLPDAVAVATQLAEGLGAAHARGIVHRDVKPANVILTRDGVVKLVDFGVARATLTDPTDSRATAGTLAYMSPEQTRGGSIDCRTDVWSFGAVLYEMLSGRHPFSGRSSDAMVEAIRNDPVVPLREVRPEVPEPLARIVRRCLEKDPLARYPDGGHVAEALREVREHSGVDARRDLRRPRFAVLGAALLLATASVAVSFAWPGTRTEEQASETAAAPSPATARLVVLPLADSSSDGRGDYLAHGLTEELRSRLAARAGLSVVGPSAAGFYRGAIGDVPRLARDLGAAAALRGVVRESGQDIRVSIQLLEAASGRELWAKDYGIAVVDLPSVPADVATDVASTLLPSTQQRELTGSGTDVAEAYVEYLKGRYFLGQLEAGATQQARDHFDRALDLDPTFAPAWSGLSGSYNQLTVQGLLSAREGGPRAREAAERALALDPDLAEAHAHLAAVLSWYYWELEGAERHFQRALALEPASARAYRHYAVHLCNLGRFDQALAAVRAAGDLDPLSPGTHMREGTILYMARRYDEALAAFQALLRIDPRHKPVYFSIALVRAQMGQHLEALAALRETDPDLSRPDALAIRGYVLGLLGRRREAHEMLVRLQRLSRPREPSSFHEAVIRVGLGEHDRAMDLLERAAEERAFQVRLLKVEPVFDPLRGDPRFQALLKELNLVG